MAIIRKADGSLIYGPTFGLPSRGPIAHPRGSRLDAMRRAAAAGQPVPAAHPPSAPVQAPPRSVPPTMNKATIPPKPTMTTPPTTAKPLTPVVFVSGLNTSAVNPKTGLSGYDSLNAYIKSYYAARLPKGTPIYVTDHRTDVAKFVNDKVGPNSPVVLAGFSLGGAASVKAANTLGSRIKDLILLDPVDPTHADKPNKLGFQIPKTVPQSIAITRSNNNVWPFSTNIAGGNNSHNVTYQPKTSDPHGEVVWSQLAINTILAALK